MIRVALAAILSATLAAVPAVAEEINISGSTSVARVMDVLAEGYNSTHPESYVAVQSVGSTAGITLLKKGVTEIAMSSRYLTEREMETSFDVTPIAFDGLAVVVNKANPVANLTREQLFNIYKGNIDNWKQVGGPDQKIAVVTREAASGSRYSFESLMGLTRIINDRLVSDISPDNLVVNGNSMVKTIVSHNKQAIGFISVGSVDRSIKALDFEGVKATNKNIGNGSYELSRPFLIIYRPEQLDKDSKQFIQYLKGADAKALISEYGYTPTRK
jgi:phosphate transport system substrate-binding protein